MLLKILVAASVWLDLEHHDVIALLMERDYSNRIRISCQQNISFPCWWKKIFETNWMVNGREDGLMKRGKRLLLALI